tara:strand:- start:2670 stop:2945 length:276 start_codon:yes stop_codon:yes gene_type:complete
METNKEIEMIYICDTCNEPSETVTHQDIIESSYGGGALVSETIEWEGSRCCGTDCYEWPLEHWISEFPSEALEYGYITQKQYNKIIEEDEI